MGKRRRVVADSWRETSFKNGHILLTLVDFTNLVRLDLTHTDQVRWVEVRAPIFMTHPIDFLMRF